jgi:alpha-1,2-mannosyltransferase
MGVEVAQPIRTGLQLVFALGTLFISWIGLQRGGPRQGVWILTAFAACYMMLFSPRTEANTYVVLVPFVALSAAIALLAARDRRTFLLLALLALALGSDNYGRAFHALTSPWFKPLVAVLFSLWLLRRVLQLPSRRLLCQAEQPTSAR